MDESFDISPNSTFSVEEEKSFLHNYGTPVHFKKLMEKPADVPNFQIKNSEEQNNSFKFLSMSKRQENRLKLDNNLLNKPFSIIDNDCNFISPMPMKSVSRPQRSHLKTLDNINMSPINYCGNKSSFSDARHRQNLYIQSTPNQRENIHIDLRFKTKENSNSKVYQTPERVSKFDTSPSSHVIWSLNRKKAEAEKQAKLESEKSNIDCHQKSTAFDELAKSFQEKMKGFCNKNLQIKEEEKKPEIVTQPNQVKKTTTFSPTLREAFLAKKARDALLYPPIAEQKTQKSPNIVDQSLTFEERMLRYKKIAMAMENSMNKIPVATKNPPVPRQKNIQNSATKSMKPASKPIKSNSGTPASQLKSRNVSKTPLWR